MTSRCPLGAVLIMTVVLGATSARATAAQADGRSTGPLTVEQVTDRWIIAPDLQVTEIGDGRGTLAGVYGGRLLDKRLLVGAGAYCLVDGLHDTDFSYFGPVVQWSTFTGAGLDVSIRTLAGLGSATRSFGLLPFNTPIPGIHHGARSNARSAASSFHPSRFGRSFGRFGGSPGSYGRYHDMFFVAEPQLSVLARLSDTVGFIIGAGYRFTNGEADFGPDLEGASGSLGFRIGGESTV